VTLEWAASAGEKNPNFLANEALNPYLRLSDCSQVSDGASAMVIVSEAGLKKMGLTEADAVEIVGTGHAVSSLFEDGDMTQLTTVGKATGRAMAGAGITARDLDLAEVHDCFTVAELMTYEAIGLARPGEGSAVVRDGATALDGSLPVNTGGGLVGFGHPVGATGVKQPVEIFRQMKGKAGDYQLQGDLSWGLTSNMGGDDKTVVSLALRNGS
jgi:acetyl-CoA acyltransferase